jgi:hypothetical protein
MKQLGAKGGRSKETALRKATRVDDQLRESARDVLARALAGDQVDREQLAAAKSLFSYRPGIPAPGEQARAETGGKPFNLADVVRVAVEVGLVRADGGRVVVEGAVVENIDPRTPREEIAHSPFQGFPSPPAR